MRGLAHGRHGYGNSHDSLLKKAVGKDWKGKHSPIIYLIAIAAAYWSQWISQFLYVVVALMWLVPDRRIENALASKKA